MRQGHSKLKEDNEKAPGWESTRCISEAPSNLNLCEWNTEDVKGMGMIWNDFGKDILGLTVEWLAGPSDQICIPVTLTGCRLLASELSH